MDNNSWSLGQPTVEETGIHWKNFIQHLIDRVSTSGKVAKTNSNLKIEKNLGSQCQKNSFVNFNRLAADLGNLKN